MERRLAAEALGTGILVTAVVGSGIMAQRLTSDVALALLANTLATGAILVVLITILAPISGAYLNPSVSLIACLRGKLTSQEAACYVAVQVLGGIAGALLAHAMFGLALAQLGTVARTGAGQWLSEGVASFGLITVILGASCFASKATPWLVGLYITSAYWFTASTSFANPAVTIARAFTDTFSGIRPIDVPSFILAQLGGALLALVVVRWLVRDIALSQEARP
jgi:glycerol uptake facilitator-like aquaporin